MPEIDPKARREVNSALANAGSANVSLMIDAANLTAKRSLKTREQRAKENAKEKAANAKEDSAVRDHPQTIPEAEPSVLNLYTDVYEY